MVIYYKHCYYDYLIFCQKRHKSPLTFRGAGAGRVALERNSATTLEPRVPVNYHEVGLDYLIIIPIDAFYQILPKEYIYFASHFFLLICW